MRVRLEVSASLVAPWRGGEEESFNSERRLQMVAKPASEDRLAGVYGMWTLVASCGTGCYITPSGGRDLMQRSHFSFVLNLLVVAAILGGCAASSEPCDKLLKRVCAAGGDALCEEVRAQQESRAGDAEASKKCQALLDEPKRLAQVLDGLRAASLLKVSLSGDAKETPDAKGPEAPKKPAAKPAAPPAQPVPPIVMPTEEKGTAPAGADGS